ncbi:chromosome partitioning protein [Microbacterium sp. CFH 31415]|uniref:MinD/ParA family ATP-binding protein n=1 Tax=Microbacterium sp. CFH 31415 TaxID=2921732 RepID=UPI001F149607|nr:chromosome partitioning protein [Microbacterium sp. CFH 31415]MCH6229548.1 chromosome partitioning protein [Microbacterium sp. CFH 31415]
MTTRTPEATVHILSSTVAEVHVGTDVEELVAADSRALRDRVVEEIRLLAASAGEPARATLVEGSSRWPLIVHPDGTFAENLEPSPPAAPAGEPVVPAPAVSETAMSEPAVPAPAMPAPAVPAPAVAVTPAFAADAPPAPTPTVMATRSTASSVRDHSKPTVQDLLESRDKGDRPRATEGWQGAVRRATGGLVSPAPGRAEQSRLDRQQRVQRRLDAPRTIVVLNPKGGAHKTTSTLLLAATFGTLRGGATLAWDNNETRGTLGWRAQNAPHHRTAVDLLEELDRFADPDGSGLATLDTYVRTQVDARFDVLASDEDAAASSTIDAAAFDRLHALLRRYYRLMIIDTGNNMRASNWIASVAAADQLVIVSTVREDTAASAAWLLDGLREKGFGEKVDRAVTVLTAPSAKADRRLESRLTRHFEQVTSGVVIAPFDPSLVDGGPVDFDSLSPATRDAWLTVAATVADRL